MSSDVDAESSDEVDGRFRSVAILANQEREELLVDELWCEELCSHVGFSSVDSTLSALTTTLLNVGTRHISIL